MTRDCEWCHASFTVRSRDNRARYCSARCRGAVRKRGGFGIRTQPDTFDESPMEWNGKTRYNTIPDSKAYTLTCLFCGELQLLKLAMPDVQAIGVKRCERCGGRMLLEYDVAMTGRIPTAAPGRPAR